MTKLYQAGPMRGYFNFNFQDFEDGKMYLDWLGHEVVSPHDIDIREGLVETKASWFENDRFQWQREFQSVELSRSFTFEVAMKRDLLALLECDAVSLLPGWMDSQGARNEYAVAKMIGLPIYEHTPWVSFATTEHRNVHLALIKDSWAAQGLRKAA